MEALLGHPVFSTTAFVATSIASEWSGMHAKKRVSFYDPPPLMRSSHELAQINTTTAAPLRAAVAVRFEAGLARFPRGNALAAAGPHTLPR